MLMAFDAASDHLWSGLGFRKSTWESKKKILGGYRSLNTGAKKLLVLLKINGLGVNEVTCNKCPEKR